MSLLPKLVTVEGVAMTSKYTRADAIEQVKIHIDNDPDVLLSLLDKSDLAQFILCHFDTPNGDEARYEAARRFLSRAVEDCFDSLVDEELRNAPW